MSEIKHRHSGIDIVYDEDTNKWVFTLRGEERSCESLQIKDQKRVQKEMKRLEVTPEKEEA